MWHIPWEVYWGFMYRIVCETGSAFRSTLPPRLYLDRDVKNQVLSSWLKRKRSDMNEGQTKDYETTARLCAVSVSCLVQLPRSFIDSLIKGRTNLRVEYNEGQSVSVCSVYPATTSLFPSAASLQSLYTLFHYILTYSFLYIMLCVWLLFFLLLLLLISLCALGWIHRTWGPCQFMHGFRKGAFRLLCLHFLVLLLLFLLFLFLPTCTSFSALVDTNLFSYVFLGICRRFWHWYS